jgi:FKBP-type peptidyl-prolyl cis-trans isomerase
MKKIMILAVVAIALISCGSKEREYDEFGNPYPDLVLNTFEERLSYSIGADMARNFKNMPEEMFELLSKKDLELGFLEGLLGKSGDRNECDGILRAAFGSPMGLDTTTNSMQEICNCYGFIFGDMTHSSLKSKDALDVIIPEVAAKGFAHALYDVDDLLEIEERNKMIADFNNDMNKKKSQNLIAEVSKFPNVKIDDAGYVLQEVRKGNGEAIDPGKEYLMIYTMMSANRDTLMSTILDPTAGDEANALEIMGSDIVEGWRMATRYMEVGGEYIVYLPFDLAYGEQGLRNPYSQGYYIQPYSGLIISSKIIAQGEKHGFIKARGEKILADAKKLPNVKVGSSGWVLETIAAGTGPKVKPGSDVTAHYVLIDSQGEIVENSYQAQMQGQPAPSFSLNGVIQAWKEAVPEMQKGGRYRLYVPYDAGYGAQGNQRIQPYETLTFEMEIKEFGEPGTLTGQF